MMLKKNGSMRTVEAYASCACAFALCSCTSCKCDCNSPVGHELQRAGLTNAFSADNPSPSNYSSGNIVYGTV